jgi:tight adherence protein B
MNPFVLAASVSAGLAAWWSIPAPVPRGVLRARGAEPAEVIQVLQRRRLRRSTTSQARTIGSLTAALASGLRSGQTPDQALQAVLCGWVGPLPGRYVPGADVVTLLERWSQVPGWGGLAAVAICWRVADSTGAGLADALDRVGQAMGHEHEVATEVDGQLASVRATASVLATLPAVAAAMGHLLGARPVEVLFGSVIGAVCLAVGTALALAGWWWLTSQVESVRKTLRW